MMGIRKKLATAAVAGGILAGSVAVAAPASATVVNVSCPTGGVTVYSNNGNGEADYCYVQQNGNTGPGWADIPGSWAVGSGANAGYVEDPYGWVPVRFTPGTMMLPDCPSGCSWTTRWVYITK
ncbi:hypothetical protein SAMN05216267_102119 [Actinacidiphila rubida]|uniref:Uncharacterized protein n=1 Tax=Actinacidiphila rubida TaxID=310780 RepID=A0A1H8N629_9ACTN|nr:hypothetical protein [Actinacidiphila rubida]SEO24903.1 hypothetical protein SAMN05216267_102119 [Actinacidiphila rubida]